jgi:hypothetical protein
MRSKVERHSEEAEKAVRDIRRAPRRLFDNRESFEPHHYAFKASEAESTRPSAVSRLKGIGS